MKIIVMGDDKFNNYPLLEDKLDHLTSKIERVDLFVERHPPKCPRTQFVQHVITWVFLRRHCARSWDLDVDEKQHSATSIYNAYRNVVSPCQAVIAFTNGGNERIEKIVAAARQLGKQVRIYPY